jgi:hypothetical protein
MKIATSVAAARDASTMLRPEKTLQAAPVFPTWTM